MIIGKVTDHRSREGGAIIYPVFSRRSGGLSIGVNLFPDRKICSFNCPYCEVFPFETDIAFNTEIMKTALRSAIKEAKNTGVPIKDICFSGNGEPTMSPFFTEALTEAETIRAKTAPEAKLVLITNGSGLLNRDIFAFLKTASGNTQGLDIWLKIDAATESWYRILNRSGIPQSSLISGIRSFAASQAPFTIQTMICKINGTLPPAEESAAWVKLITELAALSGPAAGGGEKINLRSVHIYGKARLASEDPLAEAAPLCVLEERADLLRLAFKKNNIGTQVEVYE